MSRRLVEHPGVLITALVVATLVGACSTGSMVEVFVVDSSQLGLDSPIGVALSAGCAILAMATIATILYAVLRSGRGYDGDFRRGDDDGPRDPEPDDPSGEPEWWPEFERELSGYVTEPEPPRRGAPATPG